MFRWYANLRQKAQDLAYNDVYKMKSWKATIMETVFRPDYPAMPHKGPMDMLHPDIKKLHLPHGVYIADWRKYKVEDHPALVRFQERCHRSGLHDPWLRNECHAFYENTGGGFKSRTAAAFYQCSYGFVMAVVFYIAQKVYFKYYPVSYIYSDEYVEKWGPQGKPKHH